MCDTLRNTLSRGCSGVPLHPLADAELDPIAAIFSWSMILIIDSYAPVFPAFFFSTSPV